MDGEFIMVGNPIEEMGWFGGTIIIGNTHMIMYLINK